MHKQTIIRNYDVLCRNMYVNKTLFYDKLQLCLAAFLFVRSNADLFAACANKQLPYPALPFTVQKVRWCLI
jgi:hypothetical protein